MVKGKSTGNLGFYHQTLLRQAFAASKELKNPVVWMLSLSKAAGEMAPN